MGERNGGGGGGNKREGSGGGGGGGGGRRGGGKKGRFQQHPGSGGGSSGHAIPQGGRGILVTCEAGRERRCGDEIAALVEGSFERLGAANAAAVAAAAPPASAGGDTVDARLAAEVAALRDPRKDRFRFYDTGVRGTFFLSFPSPFREPGAPGPVAVATELVEKARREGRSGSRFAQRLVPVERSCFGGLEELGDMALEVAKTHFGAVVAAEGAKEEGGEKAEAEAEAAAAGGGGGDKDAEAPAAAEADTPVDEEEAGKAEPAVAADKPAAEDEAGKDKEAGAAAAASAPAEAGDDKKKEDGAAPAPAPAPAPKPRPATSAAPGTKPLTFAVDVDIRACGRLSRAQAIDAVAEPVPCPPHKVDLTRPDATIVVQCVRNAATICVVPRYRDLLRLNLARAAQLGADEIEAREAAEAAGGAAPAEPAAAGAAALAAAAAKE